MWGRKEQHPNCKPRQKLPACAHTHDSSNRQSFLQGSSRQISSFMWDLVATAAAGLHAGAGLACIAVEHPAGLDTGVGEYWAMFPKSSTRGMTLSNALSAVSCGAALGAYFAAPEADRDPAWITCAIAAGASIPFNLLILAPTKSVIEEPASVAKPVADRESWLRSWGWKMTVGVALSGTAFLAMLLVVGTQKEENKGLTGRRF